MEEQFAPVPLEELRRFEVREPLAPIPPISVADNFAYSVLAPVVGFNDGPTGQVYPAARQSVKSLDLQLARILAEAEQDRNKTVFDLELITRGTRTVGLSLTEEQKRRNVFFVPPNANLLAENIQVGLFGENVVVLLSQLLPVDFLSDPNFFFESPAGKPNVSRIQIKGISSNRPREGDITTEDLNLAICNKIRRDLALFDIEYAIRERRNSDQVKLGTEIRLQNIPTIYSGITASITFSSVASLVTKPKIIDFKLHLGRSFVNKLNTLSETAKADLECAYSRDPFRSPENYRDVETTDRFVAEFKPYLPRVPLTVQQNRALRAAISEAVDAYRIARDKGEAFVLNKNILFAKFANLAALLDDVREEMERLFESEVKVAIETVAFGEKIRETLDPIANAREISKAAVEKVQQKAEFRENAVPFAEVNEVLRFLHMQKTLRANGLHPLDILKRFVNQRNVTALAALRRYRRILLSGDYEEFNLREPSPGFELNGDQTAFLAAEVLSDPEMRQYVDDQKRKIIYEQGMAVIEQARKSSTPLIIDVENLWVGAGVTTGNMSTHYGYLDDITVLTNDIVPESPWSAVNLNSNTDIEDDRAPALPLVGGTTTPQTTFQASYPQPQDVIRGNKDYLLRPCAEGVNRKYVAGYVLNDLKDWEIFCNAQKFLLGNADFTRAQKDGNFFIIPVTYDLVAVDGKVERVEYFVRTRDPNGATGNGVDEAKVRGLRKERLTFKQKFELLQQQFDDLLLGNAQRNVDQVVLRMYLKKLDNDFPGEGNKDKRFKLKRRVFESYGLQVIEIPYAITGDRLYKAVLQWSRIFNADPDFYPIPNKNFVYTGGGDSFFTTNELVNALDPDALSRLIPPEVAKNRETKKFFAYGLKRRKKAVRRRYAYSLTGLYRISPSKLENVRPIVDTNDEVLGIEVLVGGQWRYHEDAILVTNNGKDLKAPEETFRDLGGAKVVRGREDVVKYKEVLGGIKIWGGAAKVSKRETEGRISEVLDGVAGENIVAQWVQNIRHLTAGFERVENLELRDILVATRGIRADLQELKDSGYLQEDQRLAILNLLQSKIATMLREVDDRTDLSDVEKKIKGVREVGLLRDITDDTIDEFLVELFEENITKFQGFSLDFNIVTLLERNIRISRDMYRAYFNIEALTIQQILSLYDRVERVPDAVRSEASQIYFEQATSIIQFEVVRRIQNGETYSLQQIKQLEKRDILRSNNPVDQIKRKVRNAFKGR